MMTSSSRGSSSFLMALPKMISERPFEYTCVASSEISCVPRDGK